MKESITSEEKLDYIYKTLRKNERQKTIHLIIKWGFRVAILGYLYYFITIGVPSMIDKITPSIPTIPGISKDQSSLLNDPEKLKEVMSIPQVGEYLDSLIGK